jgi:predicted Zn-dependent protease with MMP-like domain
MTLKKFKAIARRAIRELPAMFHPHVDDLLVIVRQRPSRKLLREMGMEEDEDLLGLYDGPALTERSVSDAGDMPPTVILFYEPLLEACETEDELVHEIQATILHEIGHYFGLDEDQLEQLGYA